MAQIGIVALTRHVNRAEALLATPEVQENATLVARLTAELAANRTKIAELEARIAADGETQAEEPEMADAALEEDPEEQARAARVMQHMRFQHMLSLEPTAVIEHRRGLAQEKLLLPEIARSIDGLRTVRQHIASYDAKLVLARERDGMQAGRPEGCSCLGTGERSEYDRWINPTVTSMFCQFCPEGRAAEERHRAYLREEAKLARPAREQEILDRMGGAAEWEQYTLASYDPDPEDRDNYEQVLSYANGMGRSALFVGKPGRGKSVLAWLMVRERALADLRGAWFIEAAVLIEQIKAGFETPREVGPGGVEDVRVRSRHVPYLILDDLGAPGTVSTDFQRAELHNLINERYKSGLCTVFTSNLTMAELRKQLGQPTVDRVIEMCSREWVLLFRGKTNRRGAIDGTGEELER